MDPTLNPRNLAGYEGKVSTLSLSLHRVFGVCLIGVCCVHALSPTDALCLHCRLSHRFSFNFLFYFFISYGIRHSWYALPGLRLARLRTNNLPFLITRDNRTVYIWDLIVAIAFGKISIKRTKGDDSINLNGRAVYRQ